MVREGKFIKVDCDELWDTDIDTERKCNVPDQNRYNAINRTEPEIFTDKQGRIGVVGKMNDLRNLLKQVPKGKVIQVKQILQHTKQRYQNKGVQYACPFYGGFWSAELASVERFKLYNKKQTLDEVSPFWRIVDSKGLISPINPEQKTLLEKEGIKLKKLIDKDGDIRYQVIDLEDKIVKL